MALGSRSCPGSRKPPNPRRSSGGRPAASADALAAHPCGPGPTRAFFPARGPGSYPRPCRPDLTGRSSIDSYGTPMNIGPESSPPASCRRRGERGERVHKPGSLHAVLEGADLVMGVLDLGVLAGEHDFDVVRKAVVDG